MFTNKQSEGIILAMATPEIRIERCAGAMAGYSVKLKINFRCKNLAFLEGFQEYLIDNDVDSYLKESEGKHRPYPLLRITKPENLRKFLALTPDLPDANDRFECFKTVLTMYEKGTHMTQKGFDELLIIKGYML